MMNKKKRQSMGRKKAVIYARVSSAEQEKGFSIPAQLSLLQDYAGKEDIEVLRTFQEAESAKDAGRSAFGEMIEFLKEKSNECRTVLVEKTDRLCRNFKDIVTLDELDLELHFVKEHSVITKDSPSSDKFKLGIMVVMAKHYLDNLREETQKGMRQKAREGYWPSTAPIGYRNVKGEDGRKVIEPDPDVAPLVAQIFKWYASGNLSLSEVARMVRKSGLAAPRNGKSIHKSLIETVLKNPIYHGEISWKGERFPGKHEPLVSREIWDAAQRVLQGGNKPKRRQGRHRWAFQGFVKCGHCGCSLVAEMKKGKYTYYHCSGHRGKCPEAYVREETLAEQFGEHLRRIRLDEEVLEWVREVLRNSHQDEKEYHDRAVTILQEQVSRLQNRLDKMYVDKLDGKVAEEFFLRNSEAWRKEQDELQGTINAHLSANRSYMDEGIRVLELAQKAHALYLEQPASEKRRLLDFVFSNSTWKGGTLTPGFRQPFDLLADANDAWETKKAAGGESCGLRPFWYPFLDDFRNLCAAPPPPVRDLFLRLREGVQAG